MKVNCPEILESLCHQFWESSNLVRICRLEVFWEEFIQEPAYSQPYRPVILKSRDSIFALPLFSQLGNIDSFHQRSSQSVDLPTSSASAVEFEWYRLSRSGKLLKVIVYGATSRHLFDNQPTTGTQCRIAFIVVLYCTYMHPYIYTVSRTTVQLLHRM